MAELVELDAQPDQVLESIRVHLAGHDRGHRRAVRPGPARSSAAHSAASGIVAIASAWALGVRLGRSWGRLGGVWPVGQKPRPVTPAQSSRPRSAGSSRSYAVNSSLRRKHSPARSPSAT